ncbi:hypothetical protein [Streptomyces umbrinus]|uniref:hypothetical protein n=1 Tax=Streptomyces umbrinus TaxID=67370 RepID=UPI00343CEAF1
MPARSAISVGSPPALSHVDRAEWDRVTAVPGTKRRTWLERNFAAGIDLAPATVARLSAAVPVRAAAGDRYAPMGMASIQE